MGPKASIEMLLPVRVSLRADTAEGYRRSEDHGEGLTSDKTTDDEDGGSNSQNGRHTLDFHADEEAGKNGRGGTAGCRPCDVCTGNTVCGREVLGDPQDDPVRARPMQAIAVFAVQQRRAEALHVQL